MDFGPLCIVILVNPKHNRVEQKTGMVVFHSNEVQVIQLAVLQTLTCGN